MIKKQKKDVSDQHQGQNHRPEGTTDHVHHLGEEMTPTKDQGDIATKKEDPDPDRGQEALIIGDITKIETIEIIETDIDKILMKKMCIF